MSKNIGTYRNNQRNQRRQKNTNDNLDNLEKDLQNPVLEAFHRYSKELDEKHDRHERLVKLSRDITIESKRVIFLLHTIDGRKNNLEKVLSEAEPRLNKLIQINFKSIAKELEGYDYYQHRSAYSPGLQEFIEAYYFMEYLKTFSGINKAAVMSDWNNLQEKMKYTENTEVSENEENKTVEEDNLQLAAPRQYEFFVDPTEWILGVADLTGELMRRCINSLGSGETDVCLETCSTLKQFYTGYIMLNFHRIRDLQRKIYTMRQSVLKTETVCYNVKVRGGEAAKWGAVFDTKSTDEIDEGFY